MSSEQAIECALALFEQWVHLHGWPPVEDPVSRRENLEVQATWRRIRRNYVRAREREFAELIEDPERPGELEKLIAQVARIPR